MTTDHIFAALIFGCGIGFAFTLWCWSKEVDSSSFRGLCEIDPP